MFSQSGVDALCSATYLEDYLDSLESLPDQVQRHVSEIRRLDSDYFDAMKKTKQLKSDLARYGVHCTGKDEPATDNGIEIEPKDELPPDQRRANRAAILKHLKYLLLQSQSVSDCKLAELACINELIEAKTRQLEHDSKNMELDINDGNGVSSKAAGSSHSTESSSSQERSVRSIMRGFYRGDKDRLSELAHQLSAEDHHQGSRSEKHQLTASIASISATILTAIASEAESEAASPSTSSSLAALAETASSARQANKRPRRQKQFPDFVRTELDSSISSLPTAGSNNGGMSPSTTASSSGAPNTRSNKERTGSSGSIIPANKRKKKRQKPDSSGSGGVSGGGGGKIKFTVPVDPDEPTYCLCEQVSYGEMIGCDNNDCDIEWFHFNCVGLTSKPKGKWFCPNCRGDRPNIMKSSKN